MAKEPVLRDSLNALAAPASLCEKEGDAIRCNACAHRCKLTPGQHGLCGIRFNKDGVMFAPRNYVSRYYTRPVESTTAFHVLPGAQALSFGMFGCDLKCGYCQNWYISQAIREETHERPILISAQELVNHAVRDGAKVICAAYTEPLITAEWVKEIFTLAKRQGLTTLITTDGNATPEVLQYIRPVTDAIRVDLKTYDDENYRKLGGRLQPVLDSIKLIHRMGIWLEVVTLVAKGISDDLAGLHRIANFVAEVNTRIPLHFNAAQPRYQYEHPEVPLDLLKRAASHAFCTGLQHVYIGNINASNAIAKTCCPRCNTPVVTRCDYRFVSDRLHRQSGTCTNCGTYVAGLWSPEQGKNLRKRTQRQSRRKKA